MDHKLNLDGSAYRDVVAVWQQLCCCNGAQPGPRDLKLGTHEPFCEFLAWCETAFPEQAKLQPCVTRGQKE